MQPSGLKVGEKRLNFRLVHWKMTADRGAAAWRGVACSRVTKYVSILVKWKTELLGRQLL